MQQLRKLPVWGAYALLVYMPFHIFVSQWVSTFTGGLDVWKIAKDALAGLLLVLSVGLVLTQVKRVPRPYNTLLLITPGYFLLHLFVFGFNQQTSVRVALLATAYNNRLLWFLLIGMSSALLLGKKLEMNKIWKLVLVVSTVVSLFAIIQYFMPADFMTHFGYALERGVKPNFLINENPAFPRAMGTIRDPNSLGAYLLIPITLLVGLLMKRRENPRLITALLVVHLAALYLSFSRAAWGGLAVSLGLLTVALHKKLALEYLRRFWVVPVVLVVILGAMGYHWRSTHVVRSVVLRIDDTNAPSELDSDEHHVAYIKKGAQSVIDRPQGYGPGTAGVVSIQNDRSFLTENYYLQIAHEVGLVGLLVFAGAWLYVVWLLLKQRLLSAVVLVTVAGAYAVMAVIMHLWVNEAVAAQWWLLTGMVMGGGLRNSHNKPARPE